MIKGQPKAIRSELYARIDECIGLFAESVEKVRADQVRAILIEAHERDVAYLCAVHMLDHHPRMYLQVHAALQEIWALKLNS